MMTRRRKRHHPEQIVWKLRDADAMLNAGKDLAAVLQALEVSQSTLDRWRNQYGGMKAEAAKRLKEPEDENLRLKHLVADLSLDNQMLNALRRETGKPFPEADRGLRASREVCSLRAQGVQGVGSTADESTLRAGATRRRAEAGGADARVGAWTAAIRLLNADQSFQFSGHAALKLAKRELAAVGRAHDGLKGGMSGLPLISRQVVRFVAEAQDSAILLIQVAQECGIEQQRMITIVIQVLFLQRNRRVVVIEEERLPRFENWEALPVDTGGVEQESGPGRGKHFNHLLHWQSLVFAMTIIGPRRLLAVRSRNELECPRFHVGQIKAELDFAGDAVLDFVLVIPAVPVPTVKIAIARKGLPPLGFDELVSIAQILTQCIVDKGMQRNIDKALVQSQYVLDHMAEALSALIAVLIVPTQVAQARGKSRLHAA